MKVLITGAEGFAGSHLIEYLLNTGMSPGDIFGTFYSDKPEDSPLPAENWLQADVTEPAFAGILQQVKPDRIYHLAAQSAVGVSFKEPEHTVKTNICGILPLLGWIREQSPDTKALIVTSAEIYKDTGRTPRKEDTALESDNFYSVSKRCIDDICKLYANLYNLKIIIVRAFNHTGPGQSERFALPNFARQIALNELSGRGGIIKTGNLNTFRDFTDVRDVVKGYGMLMERGKPGEAYNVCSGILYKLEDLLDILTRLSTVKITIKTDPGTLRPADVMFLVGDNAKINRDTGWKPEKDIIRTVKDLLEFWRKKVKVFS